MTSFFSRDNWLTIPESTRYRDIGNQILTAVVSMCSSRILSRLRLVFTSKTATKRPLKDTLQEALLAVKIVRRKLNELNDRNLSKTADNFTLKSEGSQQALGLMVPISGRYTFSGGCGRHLSTTANFGTL